MAKGEKDQPRAGIDRPVGEAVGSLEPLNKQAAQNLEDEKTQPMENWKRNPTGDLRSQEQIDAQEQINEKERRAAEQAP